MKLTKLGGFGGCLNSPIGSYNRQGSVTEVEMTVFYSQLRMGDPVYILINPHGFSAKNIFGVVERILPDAAFGGGDLYMVRYLDPIDGVDRVHLRHYGPA